MVQFTPLAVRLKAGSGAAAAPTASPEAHFARGNAVAAGQTLSTARPGPYNHGNVVGHESEK